MSDSLLFHQKISVFAGLFRFNRSRHTFKFFYKLFFMLKGNIFKRVVIFRRNKNFFCVAADRTAPVSRNIVKVQRIV